MKKENKILVSGGFGFIGTNLINHLLKKGFEIGVIDFVNNNKFKNITKYIGDISDYDFVNKTILDFQPNIVFHLAGFKHRSVNVKDIRLSLESNLIGSLNIYESLLSLPNLKSVVTLGTADEYGTKTPFFEESSVEKPISPYGFSKLCATKLAIYFYQNYNLPISVLRPTIAYGPNQGLDMFIPALINSLIREKKFEMTPGNQKRDFIFISDLIDVMFKVSQNNKLKGEILNVGSGKSIMLKDVAMIIASYLKKENLLEIGSIPYRKNEVMDYNASIFKLNKKLCWQPKVNFEQGIDMTIKFFKENG